ncbi:hypothetical protein KDA11_03945 [Candidatus Saccharibacteria bacterium]|nr:hypothetical protein [Candidatus Saccharibacteria bacterium]
MSSKYTHYSPAPEICGTFNLDKAIKLAQKMAPDSDRHILQNAILFDRSQGSRHSAGARAFKQISPKFNQYSKPSFFTILSHRITYKDIPYGLSPRWHTDPESIVIGYSSRPTQFLVGTVDITPLAEAYHESVRDKVSPLTMLAVNRKLLESCVELALSDGSAEIAEPIQPGKIIAVDNRTIHRSDLLNVEEVYQNMDTSRFFMTGSY